MLAFQFAHPFVLIFALPLLGVLSFYKFKVQASSSYFYPLASELAAAGFVAGEWKKRCIWLLRGLALLGLIILAARPQWVDVFSKLYVEGIDIVLSLDLSKSMMLSDDFKDRRRRVEVAKAEAINFIDKRDNDSMGLVVFGAYSLTLSPLTLDKAMLKQVVKDLTLDTIDSTSTALGKGLASAARRLRNSDAKSKVVILLTDGRPSSPDDIPLDKAIKIAQEYGVKVYAVGIGGSRPFLIDEFGRMHGAIDPVHNSADPQLLQKIATQTGGQFFYARNPQEMKDIYTQIDKLEKRSQETNIFSKYFEIFWPFILLVLGCIALEMILTGLVWRGLW